VRGGYRAGKSRGRDEKDRDRRGESFRRGTAVMRTERPWWKERESDDEKGIGGLKKV
jgi:hypothetical protein